MAKIKVKRKKKKAAETNIDMSVAKGGDLTNVLCDAIHRKFGKESILKMSQAPIQVPIITSSGIPRLDAILGRGGFPRGRLIEVIGPESSGKTTLCLHTIAAAQKDHNATAAFIDAEHALDPAYARNLGVNVDSLLVSQPDSGEQVFDIVETLVKTNRMLESAKPLILVVDSIAAIIPRSEIEGEQVGDGRLGAHAQLMSMGLKRLVNLVKGSNVLIMFTNQIRHKIGVKFGSPETTPGGNAMKFYATIRIDIRNIGKEKAGEEIIGNKVRIKTIKNKVAPPFQQIEAMMRYGIGIDIFYDKLMTLVEGGKIIKKGAWYSFAHGTQERIGCGINAARDFDKKYPHRFENLLLED